MFSLLPLAIKLASATTLMAGLFGFGLYVGHQWGDNARKDALIASYKEGMEIAEKQTVVTEKIVTKYVDRVKIIEKTSEEINNEIPNFIKADHDTFLSGGFRVWHDAASQGEIPDPTLILDARIVGVDQISATIGFNYSVCFANKQQLDSLQQWIRDQSEIK